MHPVSEVSGKTSKKSWQDFLTLPLHAWLGASNVPESWAPNKRWGGKNKPQFLWPTAVKSEKLSNLSFCVPSLRHFCPWTPNEHTPRKVPCTELGAKAGPPLDHFSQTLGIWQTYVTRKCDFHIPNPSRKDDIKQLWDHRKSSHTGSRTTALSNAWRWRPINYQSFIPAWQIICWCSDSI